MKLKLDENGHVVVVEGKPVYVHDDGKEIEFDGKQAFEKIAQQGRDIQNYKTRFEATVAELKGFEGIDATAAKDALDKVSKLDQKKLIDAGEVDKVRNEVQKVYETRLSESEAKRQKAEQALTNEMIGGNFARSKFRTDKMAENIPIDMVQATFGGKFSIEDGKVVATDSHGNKIYSRANAGELATFDEALEALVESHPSRDSLLKGNGSQGSGAQRGNPNKGGPDLSKLPPVERMNAAREIKAT